MSLVELALFISAIYGLKEASKVLSIFYGNYAERQHQRRIERETGYRS